MMDMNKTKKMIPMVIIILGFFTLGLTDLIWIYQASDKVNRYRFPPIKQLALIIITFGIYGIFWTYMLCGELPKSEKNDNNKLKYICTVLSVIFLRNISVAMIVKRIFDIEEKQSLEN